MRIEFRKGDTFFSDNVSGRRVEKVVAGVDPGSFVADRKTTMWMFGVAWPDGLCCNKLLTAKLPLDIPEMLLFQGTD